MSGADAQISLGEKLTDASTKIKALARIVPGLLPGGRFTHGKQEIRGSSYTVFKTLPDRMADTYDYYFDKVGNKPWIHYEDEVITFQEGRATYQAFASEVRSGLGAQVGESVGICMKNLPEFMLAFLGATASGCRAVPFHSLWGTKELEYAFKDCDCKVLVCDPARLELCKPFLAGSACKVILVRGERAAVDAVGALMWDDVIKAGRGKPKADVKGIKAEDDAMIMYTSGSTGFPKGVVHTQRSLGTALKTSEILACVKAESNSKGILAVPLFHITALMNVFLHSMCIPTELFIMKKWDAGKALEIIEKNRTTRFIGVPTMIRDMLEHKDFTPERVASMDVFSAGGAPVPPLLVERVRAITKEQKTLQGYGLTETAGGCLVNSGLDYLKRPTSCGKPIPFVVEVEVRDAETNKKVADGESGELCIRSAMNFARYHNRPEDTKKAVDPDGFFHTGDVARMEGPFVFILDRLKDLIIRGGENISCAEVEAALYSHPAVRECSVFALPDERLGEVVGTAIWLQGEATAADISQHAAAKLPKYMVPEAQNVFFHTEELPKGATGKLDKKGLRERYSKQAKNPPMSKM